MATECEHEWTSRCAEDEEEGYADLCGKCGADRSEEARVYSLEQQLTAARAATAEAVAMARQQALDESELVARTSFTWSQAIEAIAVLHRASLTSTPAAAPAATRWGSAWGVFDTWDRTWCPRSGTEQEMGQYAVKLNFDNDPSKGDPDNLTYRYQPLPLPPADLLDFDRHRAARGRTR